MDLTQHFYQTYTKQQLAEILAEFATTGQVPPIPTERAYVSRIGKRGRPNQEEQAALHSKLRDRLAYHYPVEVDLPTLSAETGISLPSLKKLQKSLDFQATLPGLHQDYFAGLPSKLRGRLTIPWQAVLDLHNYALTLEHPGLRLPLYRVHTLLWGSPVNLSSKDLYIRDYKQQQRVYRPEFKTLLLKAGWELTEPALKKDDVSLICVDGCSIAKAFVDGADVTHVATARKLIDLPWLPTDRTFIAARTSTEALAQLIGIE